MSVLICEDHPGLGAALAAVLDLAGYRVTLTRSFALGRAALAERPHVVIADDGLPDGRGADLIRIAKAADPDCACIGTSGSPAAEPEMIAAGADAFLPKPVEFRALFPLLPAPRVAGA